ncbi:unnamed protein product [Amoebophrya sp. A25]|nr:unnamed protein product [Amoebophrya sp. A25]|eukprot:GSA25T00003317001.1
MMGGAASMPVDTSSSVVRTSSFATSSCTEEEDEDLSSATSEEDAAKKVERKASEKQTTEVLDTALFQSSLDLVLSRQPRQSATGYADGEQGGQGEKMNGKMTFLMSHLPISVLLTREERQRLLGESKSEQKSNVRCSSAATSALTSTTSVPPATSTRQLLQPGGGGSVQVTNSRPTTPSSPTAAARMARTGTVAVAAVAKSAALLPSQLWAAARDRLKAEDDESLAPLFGTNNRKPGAAALAALLGEGEDESASVDESEVAHHKNVEKCESGGRGGSKKVEEQLLQVVQVEQDEAKNEYNGKAIAKKNEERQELASSDDEESEEDLLVTGKWRSSSTSGLAENKFICITSTSSSGGGNSHLRDTLVKALAEKIEKSPDLDLEERLQQEKLFLRLCLIGKTCCSSRSTSFTSSSPSPPSAASADHLDLPSPPPPASIIPLSSEVVNVLICQILRAYAKHVEVMCRGEMDLLSSQHQVDLDLGGGGSSGSPQLLISGVLLEAEKQTFARQLQHAARDMLFAKFQEEFQREENDRTRKEIEILGSSTSSSSTSCSCTSSVRDLLEETKNPLTTFASGKCLPQGRSALGGTLSPEHVLPKILYLACRLMVILTYIQDDCRGKKNDHHLQTEVSASSSQAASVLRIATTTKEELSSLLASLLDSSSLSALDTVTSLLLRFLCCCDKSSTASRDTTSGVAGTTSSSTENHVVDMEVEQSVSPDDNHQADQQEQGEETQEQHATELLHEADHEILRALLAVFFVCKRLRSSATTVVTALRRSFSKLCMALVGRKKFALQVSAELLSAKRLQNSIVRDVTQTFTHDLLNNDPFPLGSNSGNQIPEPFISAHKHGILELARKRFQLPPLQTSMMNKFSTFSNSNQHTLQQDEQERNAPAVWRAGVPTVYLAPRARVLALDYFLESRVFIEDKNKK